DAGDFLETRTTLFKLKAIESLVDVSGELVSDLALIVLTSFVVILFSIAFALLLGNWLGEMYYGFFIIGGVYSIAALIIYAKRNQWLKDPFSNMLIRKILK
ncbi:MAG TPA: hypothetical protein VNU72_05065, partial [Puia sp.]|nr:hypothetical protein [Puia sp.]